MNSTEKSIKHFYKAIQIRDPVQLSINNIVEQISLPVYYWPYSSEITEYQGQYKIFINEQLNDKEQWTDFGHEMSHYFRDKGNPNILRESFIDYCEAKADYFAYHFCVPTFMLMDLREVTVYEIMRLFNVEFDFALRRLEMYQSKIIMKGESKWQKDMQGIAAVTSGN